jgi:hypothetical protein
LNRPIAFDGAYHSSRLGARVRLGGLLYLIETPAAPFLIDHPQGLDCACFARLRRPACDCACLASRRFAEDGSRWCFQSGTDHERSPCWSRPSTAVAAPGSRDWLDETHRSAAHRGAGHLMSALCAPGAGISARSRGATRGSAANVARLPSVSMAQASSVSVPTNPPLIAPGAVTLRRCWAEYRLATTTLAVRCS